MDYREVAKQTPGKGELGLPKKFRPPGSGRGDILHILRVFAPSR